MSGRAGRGTRGRASGQKSAPLQQQQQQQQLPHAQHSASSGTVRRPGQSASQISSTTGRGTTQRVGEKGDSAAVGQIGRGMEKLEIQPTAGGDAGANAGAAAVVVSGRGAARGKRILPADILITKPSHISNKKGSSGSNVILKANYFRLLKSTDWSIQQYRVDFVPEEDRTIVRKGLLKVHKHKIGAYIFDGTVIYTTSRLPEKMTFTSKRQSDEAIITINVRLVADMVVGDSHYIQFFNIIMRKCFECLNLKLVGRNYFDPENKVSIPDYKLELWPGYVTSIRQHEREILMCAEITSKVMRLETIADILESCYRSNSDNYQKSFENAVIGTVVLTEYNNNTYRVEDIDFSKNALHTFDLRNGDKISYADYYYKKYKIRIQKPKQPLLVAKSRTKGFAGDGERIYLVPELCRATGLTDSMRENFRLMSSLAQHTRLDPRARMTRLMSFNSRLDKNKDIQQEFSEWNLKLDHQLLDVPARVLGSEVLTFGSGATVTANKGDWSREMQNKSCLVAANLRDWVLIVTDRDKHAIQTFLNILTKVARGVAFNVDTPDIQTIRDDRPGTFNDTLERILSKKIPQLVFCVVSNNRSDRYSAIKKKCCVDRPVPSQVCLFKTLTHKSIMSIATKIAIQMNCKLGGAPWCVDIPLDGMMVVGFDVCHDTMAKNKDFGATVASLNRQMTKYFSAVNAHKDGDELSKDLSNNICRAAQAYVALNKCLPGRIVIYRDGVGEGQVPQVMEREVVEIEKGLNVLYGGPDKYKLEFIIVTKRLNTRLFLNGNNPPPGTIVDDFITSPIKYDFFIVSQQVRQGTVTPTSYSVIVDKLGLDPDKIQRLTYKLTHVYYNCSTTVRVPAPCHYAHKLAFLVSRFIHRAPDATLQRQLYFL